MRFKVTGTCYPEAQVPLGNIGSVQEMEFDMQVARQKEKLVEMSANINRELAALVATKGCSIQIERSEKTLKERYLEAVSCGWRTVKEVCIQVHPGITEGSSEKERAMKSTSMFLMRLYNSSLVHRWLGKTGFEYILSAKGLRSLLFYDRMMRDEAVRTERKRIQHDQMEKIVKLNDEIVPEIMQMRTHNAEIMKKLDDNAAAVAVHQIGDMIVREFTLQIIELQRAIIDGDDDSRIHTLVQSTKLLLRLGEVEMAMSGEWQNILEAQKQSRDMMREADVKLNELFDRNQRSHLKYRGWVLNQILKQLYPVFVDKIRRESEKANVRAVRQIGETATLGKDPKLALNARKKLLKSWFSKKTDASSDLGNEIKEQVVLIALHAASSNAHAILKEIETKTRSTDPQTAKKAEILLESLKVCFLPKDGQTDLDENSTAEETPQRMGKYTLVA